MLCYIINNYCLIQHKQFKLEKTINILAYPNPATLLLNLVSGMISISNQDFKYYSTSFDLLRGQKEVYTKTFAIMDIAPYHCGQL